LQPGWGLGEIRVLTVHVNSGAFRHSINSVRMFLRQIFAKALFQQVDMILEISTCLPIANFIETPEEHSLVVWPLKSWKT